MAPNNQAANTITYADVFPPPPPPPAALSYPGFGPTSFKKARADQDTIPGPTTTTTTAIMAPNNQAADTITYADVFPPPPPPPAALSYTGYGPTGFERAHADQYTIPGPLRHLRMLAYLEAEHALLPEEERGGPLALLAQHTEIEMLVDSVQPCIAQVNKASEGAVPGGQRRLTRKEQGKARRADKGDVRRRVRRLQQHQPRPTPAPLPHPPTNFLQEVEG